MKTGCGVTTFAAGVMLLFVATGCAAHTTPTVGPENVAKAAADALEQTVGSRPHVDCGSKQIPLVDGTKASCTVNTPGQSLTYDSTVTISHVKGTDYSVAVDVAKTPRN